MNEDFVTSKLPTKPVSIKVSQKLDTVTEVNQEGDNKILLEEDTSLHPRLTILTDKKDDVALGELHHYHRIQEITNCNDIIKEEGDGEDIDKTTPHKHKIVEEVIDKVEGAPDENLHDRPLDIPIIEEEKEDSTDVANIKHHVEEEVPIVDEVMDVKYPHNIDTFDCIDENEEFFKK
jgi:hypothetical protein